MPKKSDKSLKLAKLKCKKSVVIFGRNDNGESDQCFTQGGVKICHM